MFLIEVLALEFEHFNESPRNNYRAVLDDVKFVFIVLSMKED